MNDMNEQGGEASGPDVPADASWIERLTDAANDFESVGAEDAAGLGW